MLLTVVCFLAQGIVVPQQAVAPAPSEATVAAARIPPPAPSASQPTPISTNIISPIVPGRPAAVTAAEAIRPTSRPPTASRGKWLALSLAQHSAASFDAWTTRRKLEAGGYHENNPLLRPFAGNNSLYAAIQVTPALFDFIGDRMRRSDRRWVRHFWWLPQSIQTGTHLTCGAINLAR